MKFLNISIKNGKKTLSLKSFLYMYKSLKYYCILNNLKTPSIVIYTCFNNACPVLSVKKIKKSNKFFYLPKLISSEEEINIVIYWFSNSIKNRKDKKLNERLTNEVFDCYKGFGSTITKKRNLYDIIIASRPFLNLLLYR